jgi:SAM-dependent methyltransferase
MTDPTTTTSRTYDRVAAEYHAKRLDRSIIQTRLDQLSALLTPTARILDLGCGPGFDSAAIRQRGHCAIGADLSSGMLDFARRQYPGPYIRTDMRRLPFGPAFDAVWASASMLHLEIADFSIALGECFRVLERGGHLALSLKEGEGQQWENGRFSVDAPRFFTYWTDAALDQALGTAGFTTVEQQQSAGLNGPQTWLFRLVQKPV